MKKSLRLSVWITSAILISGFVLSNYARSQGTTEPANPSVSEEDKPSAETADTPAPPFPTASGQVKIGVVNLAEAFSRYQKKSELEALLKKETQKEELKIKDIEGQLKKLVEELDGDVLAPNSPLRKEKQEDLAVLQARREHLLKNWNKWLQAKVNEHTVKLYNEIREVIDAYAKENNYTLILKIDPPVSAENATEEINFRSVVYYHPSLDITEEIIKILNK